MSTIKNGTRKLKMQIKVLAENQLANLAFINKKVKILYLYKMGA